MFDFQSGILKREKAIEDNIANPTQELAPHQSLLSNNTKKLQPQVHQKQHDRLGFGVKVAEVPVGVKIAFGRINRVRKRLQIGIRGK